MADEARRKAEKPVAPLTLALELFAGYMKCPQKEFVGIRQLESYDDCNFYVELTEDRKFLFKLHNGVETDNDKILDAQTSMMQLLSSAGIRTQTPVASRVGDGTATKQLVTVPMSGGSDRHAAARVFHWVPGKPLVGIATPERLEKMGQLLGTVQNALQSNNFDHPGLHRYHQWDLCNTGDLKQFMPCITDKRRHDIVASVIDAFEAAKPQLDETMRKGAIQADFNDANVIVGKDDQLGVIDFGDIVHTWVINEVAIGCAYATVSSYGKDNPLGAAAALLRGAAKTFKLSDEEIGNIRLLAACRLAISVTLGAYSYQKQPECKYLLLHAEPGWQSLEALWVKAEERDVTALFTKAAEGQESLESLQLHGARILDQLCP